MGFAALFVAPGLANPDLSLLAVARASFPPWFLGIVGEAGALTALVPAAVVLLTASAIFVKNGIRPRFSPAMTDSRGDQTGQEREARNESLF